MEEEIEEVEEEEEVEVEEEMEEEMELYLFVSHAPLSPSLSSPLFVAFSWGFTVYTEKQHWYFCCEEKESQVSWVNAIIRMKFGSDFWSKPVPPPKTGPAAPPPALKPRPSGPSLPTAPPRLKTPGASPPMSGGPRPLGDRLLGPKPPCPAPPAGRRPSAGMVSVFPVLPRRPSTANGAVGGGAVVGGADGGGGDGGGGAQLTQSLMMELSSVLKKTNRCVVETD
ncbi:unnamed protein product [Gadus morhua 'NCC']